MCNSAFFVRQVGTVGILAALAAMPVRPQAAAQEKTAVTSGTMRVTVLDAAGQPLPAAKLRASVWTNEKDFKSNQSYTCDSAGVAEIALPRTVQIVRVWAAKDGHAGMFLNLHGDLKKDEFVLPSEFTFRLPPGTVMGGVVKDEDGQPIAGARVELMYEPGRASSDDQSQPSFSLDGFRLTDASGRWQFNNVPPGDDVQVRVLLSHPGYISDSYWGEVARKQNITANSLRAETATIVMQRGINVTGKVTDPSGKPVAGAVVIWGDRPYMQSGSQEVRTGEDGTYQFGSLPPGQMRLTVAAEGWMPESRKVEISRQMPPADFSLKPGKKLRIRFVDPSGTPVPGVGVSIGKWRGSESLYNHKHPNVIDTKVPTKAGEDGVFEWSWAPDDAVTFTFYKAGFAQTEASITADDTEHMQKINHILRFTGSVRDAATGKGIDDFLVIPVIYFSPDFPSINRQDAERQKGGEFSLELERTDIEHGVQIEAPGYVTYRSPGRYKSGDANPGLKVILEPVEPYVGRVVDQAGQPIQGARVYVATGFQHLDLFDLNDRGGQFTSNYRVTTDRGGAFEIVPPIERYAVLAVADAGYAEVQRAASERPGEIRIQPWARVAGKLIQDDQPVKNCKVYVTPVRLRNGEEPRMDVRFSVQTDDDGSFAFEKVPPIPCHVRGYLHWSVDSPLMSSRSLPLHPAPGETANITLGGAGIEVTGQLIAENQPANFDYHFSITYLVAKRPGIEPPPTVAAKEFDWRKGWSDSWRSSLEGGAYLDTLHHWFVKPTPDGRIRISGVEPGEYEFAVNLYGTTEGCLVYPLATRVIPIAVHPGDANLDLGKLTIPSLARPQVGEFAPEFEFATLDGKPSSLAALRGKYVLLDFWATWCGPCVAKLDEVERLRKQHAEGDRFIVVGVNLDEDTERARAFLRSRSLPWQHTLLGDWSATDVPQRFAIANVPAYVLIGPDGRIAAQESSLEVIEKKLAGLMAP